MSSNFSSKINAPIFVRRRIRYWHSNSMFDICIVFLSLQKQITPMKRLFKRSAFALLLVFIIANIVAFMHAYRFTHFSDTAKSRTADPHDLSWGEKIGILFTGIENPRPQNTEQPTQSYSVISVNSTERLECWKIPVDNARGTVVMFHGYAGKKSSLLHRAQILNDMGFNTILVDLMGSGGSGGSVSTVGYDEAEQVKDCFEFFREDEMPVYLFGTSMGAAAILKASEDYHIKPAGILLECPFGSLYKTVSARFEMMKVPSFPMAALLTFWGGMQHGYWAFSHNPTEYARSVEVPTLLMFGEQDDRVSREEIDEIFLNLRGPKTLKTYSGQGHDLFSDNEETWREDVRAFIE